MTAVKKPYSRRAVFDATFGDFSINNNTPEKEYLGETYQFTFPTVLDLAYLVVKLGQAVFYINVICHAGFCSFQ